MLGGKVGPVRDLIVAAIYNRTRQIADQVVKRHGSEHDLDQKIDRLVTSKVFGYPLMLALLSLIFWLTISGANYPSQLLSNLLFGFQGHLTAFCQWLNVPDWLHGVLVLGLYRSLAWVVSVMLPPMAIFFPLFTFLEDLGYLPRVAFNLDRLFKRAGAHGKQVLTMCMGFGCNAAGVTACRIIESPRERLIAVLTNNFVPCNGRFPLLITMAMVLLGAWAVTPIPCTLRSSWRGRWYWGFWLPCWYPGFYRKHCSKGCLPRLPWSFLPTGGRRLGRWLFVPFSTGRSLFCSGRLWWRRRPGR